MRAFSARHRYANGAQLLFYDTFNALSLSNYVAGTTGTWRLGGRSYQPAGYAEQYDFNVNPFNPSTPFYLASVNNSIMAMEMNNTPSQYAAACNNLPYVSAWMDTRDLWSAATGYFEARMSVSIIQGCGTAFWLEPQNGNISPQVNIFEVYNEPSGLVMDHNLYATDNNGLSNYYLYSGQTGSNGFPGAGANTDLTQMHTYGVNLQSDFVTFYMDRAQTEQFATPWTPTPMYIILSSGMPGSFVGSVTNPSALPCYAYVDYVAVWDKRPF